MPLGNLPVSSSDSAANIPAKSKKFTLTLVIILGLVLLAALGFGAYRYFKKHNNKFSQVKNQASSVPELAASIIKSGKIEDCIELKDQIANGVNYQTVCTNNIAQNLAQTNLDIKACEKLDNKLMAIADCQQMVVAGIANKAGNPSACDQFTSDLKTSCISAYWSSQAIKQKDPKLCSNITPSSEQVIMNCQSFVLTSLLTPVSSTSTTASGLTAATCSLFTGSVKTDCNNYLKGDCRSLAFPPLQQVCQRRTR